MASPARTLERQALLVNTGTTYGSSDINTTNTTAPEEIARRFLEQALLTAEQEAPITIATAQNTLQLPEGTYVGDLQDGQPHGYGTLTYHPGNDRIRYTGLWKSGKFHGKGILIYADNSRYEGTFKEGAVTGKGIKHFADHSIYEGPLIRGQMHGKGTMRFSNGDFYDGYWRNGYREATGTYTWRNGDTYTGAWKDSKKEGKGVLVRKDGSRVEGVFKNDVIWEGNLNGTRVTKGGPLLDGIHRIRCALLAVGIVIGLTITGSGLSMSDATTALVFYIVGGALTALTSVTGLIFRKAICNQPRDSDSW